MEDNKTYQSENTQEVAEPVEDKVFVNDEIDEVSEPNTEDNTASEPEEHQASDDVEATSENKQEVAEPVKPKQSDEDNKEYARARREAEQQMKEMKQQQEDLAKSLGYSSFDEMKNSHLQQKYIEEGYDPETAERMVRFDKMEREMMAEKNKARIANEKLELKNKRFFNDLESDIDAFLENVPDAKVEVIFDMLKGQKLEELIEKASKTTKQKTLNNLNNKSHVKPDGKGVEHNPVNVDPDEFAIYKRLNPKATMNEYVKFKKSNN